MAKSNKFNKKFEIISLSREDILGLEKQDKKGNVKRLFTKKDILSLTNEDMVSIASKLSDDYCEQLYWTSLEIIVENYLTRKKEQNEINNISL